MSMYKGKSKKIILLIFFSFMFGIIIAFGEAGYKYLKAGNNRGKYQLDSSYMKKSNEIKLDDEKYCISEKGGELEIKLPRQYVNKFTFEYFSEFFSGASIEVKKENIYGVIETQSICDKFMKDMPRSVVSISGIVTEIKIIFDESHNQLQVWNLGVDNSFKINPFIAIFFACAIFLIGFLVIYKEENAQNPSLSLFIVVLISSTCLILSEPPYIVGWDEQIHYNKVYMLGVSEKGEKTTQVEEYMYGYPFLINTLSEPAQESIEERLDWIRVLSNKKNNPGIFEDDYEWSITSFGYIFQALALKIANFFHLPFYLCWIAGKFANVLLYACVMSFAVYVVPIGKRLLMVIAMMPTMVFQSTVYTYDVTVIAFITLAIAVLIKEIMASGNVFKYKWRVVFFLSFIMGCLPKAVYAPLILGGLFVGKDKFYSDKDRKLYRGLIIFGFLALMMTFVLPTLISPDQIGDARGGDTSGVGQMHYIMGQPFSYAFILMKNVLNTLQDCLLGAGVLCHFAYLGVGRLSTLAAVLLIGVVLTDKYNDGIVSRKALSLKERIGILFLIGLVIALIWTALYLSFTEVGKTSIAGVQARYYLPFLFLFYLCFQTDKIQNNFSKVKYQLTVMLMSVMLLLQQIWQLILTQKCL